MDDSKWLIGVRNHAELTDLFDAEYFYFVLFDFFDFVKANDINTRIWRVDPRSKGFAYCMIDYYYNIGSQSMSGAPFNLWPFKLKFVLLGASRIFQAIIRENDEIEFGLFSAGTDSGEVEALPSLTTYNRAGGQDLGINTLKAVAKHLNLSNTIDTKREMLAYLEHERAARSIPDAVLISALCDALYGRRIETHIKDLPPGVGEPEFLVP